jgi:hypothetical protein
MQRPPRRCHSMRWSCQACPCMLRGGERRGQGEGGGGEGEGREGLGGGRWIYRMVIGGGRGGDMRMGTSWKEVKALGKLRAVGIGWNTVRKIRVRRGPNISHKGNGGGGYRGAIAQGQRAWSRRVGSHRVLWVERGVEAEELLGMICWIGGEVALWR